MMERVTALKVREASLGDKRHDLTRESIDWVYHPWCK